jgi:hypothetical protein
MELEIWLLEIAIWRLQREHTEPKEDKPVQSEDKELPAVSYPQVLAAS